MSVCGGCDPCENTCADSCCNNACLRWGFDGCYLRGRCADGTELTPLDLCAWLKVHETCTELLLVPDTSHGEQDGGYMLYKNECGEEYKFWVCDFLSLASIRCLKDVYDYSDPDSGEPDAVKPCDLFVFSPDCSRDPDNPIYNKWVPYTIPDAGDCVIQPDADGYSKVLIKDECGCIRECKLFVQQNTYEYALRDSWPDDPDWPFTHGSFTEVIDIQLDSKIPMWGVTDLEVTVQYAYGIQNHGDGISSRRNFKSIVTPSDVNDPNPSLADTYSKAIVLQGSNLIPWGSWEWQASRSFIVPKGKKLFLVNKVECRDINGNMMGTGDSVASSRLHALHVFVRATKGVKV
jgi:hypothetical protein